MAVILEKLILVKKYVAEVICYYEQLPITIKSDFFHKISKYQSKKVKGFKYLFDLDYICKRFCQSFYGRICQAYNKKGNLG